MRFRTGRVDPSSAALIAGGVVLLAVAVVVGGLLLSPGTSNLPVERVPTQPGVQDPGRPSAVLAAERVATVLMVDPSSGAGGAARSGDRVDILGYFPSKVTGTQGETRVILQDVPVLTAARSGGSVALTLAVPHQAALLLQEAQAIGAHPLVTLRAARPSATPDDAPNSFSDADQAVWLAGTR